MTARPIKRSLTLKGHRTSVSLETEFWLAFRKIADEKQIPINELAAKIDADRGLDSGLASAIRVFVLTHYQAKVRPSE
ncbi:Ribbon-helix-helix domain-containing protein [Shimia gijangensis]|uniref:Ribbon-helix-helix domain-containing protein n=1 Tax=Shimia gijangensis TaxID=1470563 RepID=A0A1M6QU11_9RHOB|nr:ribbon-helix-helix domain-containing protein [Shimia gijangensis]SHK23590.1 Ribbon-helix-helix domain-containing protein [Shimia gijangensis]